MSLKAGFAQIFSCCPKNLSCPKFGGAAAPLAPPARTPMVITVVTQGSQKTVKRQTNTKTQWNTLQVSLFYSFHLRKSKV